MADEAICIGKAPALKSYLSIDKILDAVSKTGADCVHPGYGFLSENINFANALTNAGIIFIGPNSKAISNMGDKINSKQIAIKAGVNTILGHDGNINSEEECVLISNQIGYPVMIKASAGGGGKGMRIAWNDAEARNGFRISQQEALISFGDDKILIEKFIEKPRHIEMQILCDKKGNAICLNERECSIQRRNQKLIEEAPSSFVDSELRKKMSEQAIRLAKAVNYDSAGTVEFLVDSKKNFYFLEMNTRLQVEHPITEQITGVDLVQQMFRIAYGHSLNIKQSEIKINGWAFECRVYAENPYKDFGLPSIGRLTKYIEPKTNLSNLGTIRCDSGIQEGSEISIYYDPLICKLISHSSTRKKAQELMKSALDNFVIKGLSHNIPLLYNVFDERKFTEGNVNTKYLFETYPNGFKGCVLLENEKFSLFAISSLIYSLLWNRKNVDNSFKNNFLLTVFFENDLDNNDTNYFYDVNLKIESEKAKIEIFNKNTGTKFELFENFLNFNLAFYGLHNFKINNEIISIQFCNQTSSDISLIYKGSLFTIKIFTKEAFSCLKYMKKANAKDVFAKIVSPMPGTIKSMLVKVGDLVSEGQELCTIEAMKMQNILIAEKSGKIKAINCKIDENVDNDVLLIEIE